MVRMANSSGEAAQELVLGMSEISSASKKIGDIITTVNEVAFQTNLLALNAAVEAARAGEHGKGFAVVAEEVRALAQRSADASKQIKTLIEDTVNKIEAGDAMVKKSGESLEQIIKHIQELSQVMEEIAAASSEQASGVDELNRAVTQIDSTTQQNASTVEELASTSDNLSNEAKDLSITVARFKVSQEVTVPAATGSAPKKPVSVKKTAEPVKESSGEFEDDFEEF
jgi:methyl-accepting chemotaxis protein